MHDLKATVLIMPIIRFFRALQSLLPQLASTEEFIDGQFTGNLGEVLIRCATLEKRARNKP